MGNIHQVITFGGRTFLTTEELATALSLSAQSIRKRYAQTG
ncbi:hypothetical protein [Burkholderia cenocepacia]|nr:hypothetical protein [Burkholderia cenocepacia]